MTMEEELKDKHHASSEVAHECIESAKKQLNVVSDIEAERQRSAIMAAADDTCKATPMQEMSPEAPSKDASTKPKGEETTLSCPLCCKALIAKEPRKQGAECAATQRCVAK